MQHVKGFFRFGPYRNDHHPAIRCGIGVGIPLVVLLLPGRFDLMVFASFGAFTGIYARGEAHGARLAHQGQAGAILVLCMLAGALTSMSGAGPWAVVAGTAVVAGA
ncbi:MAG: FUSC family protein, partial [Actinomycetes bacterium]